MNKKVFSAAILASAAMAMTSCSSSKNAQNENATKAEKITEAEAARPSADEEMDESYLILSEAQQNIVKKNNDFAFKLYQQISGMDSEVVSPMSIAYLMGMLANGADGKTQQEILKAIGCEGVSVKELNDCYKALMLSAGKLDKQTTVNIANFIAINKNFTLNSDFARTVADSYQAGVESMDFTNSKSAARINEWCKKQTKGMIPSIIDQVDPAAVSYLLNAIYFNGIWQEKFDAKNTRLENFSGYTRDIKKVNMMHLNKKFAYTENDMLQAVELPYGNGSYQMTVLLPKAGKSISEVMKEMDADKLQKLSNDMDRCQVDLKFPKFTTEMDLSLNQIISKLGAPSIFQPGTADFSRFANGNFYVSKMLQKAKIEVSERGTKAAAVTAAVMLTSLGPHELKAYIESQGGKVTGSVSKSTNFLINNDAASQSSKNKKAHELNIPIITEDEFIEKFQEQASE
jgi:serine protease inhibitor